jgi:hypothetical protein
MARRLCGCWPDLGYRKPHHSGLAVQVYAHVDGGDPFGLHHLLPLLIGSFSFLGMYVVLFWAKVRELAVQIKIKGGKLLAGIRKLFRSRR